MSQAKANFLKINWVDQITDNPKKTADFYSDLLGFEQGIYDEGNGLESFFLTDENGEEVFGIVEEAVFKDWLHGWVIYFEVENLDSYCERIEELGGKIISRRKTQCLFKDPSGAPTVIIEAGSH